MSQALKDSIAGDELIPGEYNRINAVRLNSALAKVIDHFTPETGDVVYKNFYRHIIAGDSIMDFENHFVSGTPISDGEYARINEQKFLKAEIDALQTGQDLVPAAAISGSFTLSTDPYSGSPKSHTIDVSGLTDDLEYVIKLYRDDGDITKMNATHGSYVTDDHDLALTDQAMVLSFVKETGETDLEIEYDLYENGSTTSINYVIRALRATSGSYSGKGIYRIEKNGEVKDFVFINENRSGWGHQIENDGVVLGHKNTLNLKANPYLIAVISGDKVELQVNPAYVHAKVSGIPTAGQLAKFSDEDTLVAQPGVSFDGSNNATFANDVTVNGNLVVAGSTIQVNAEVKTTDAVLEMNDGEVGPGVTLGFSGSKIARGTQNDYWFGFDEVRNTFTIGEITALSAAQIATTHRVATMVDNPTDTYVGVWDGANNRMNFVDSTTLATSGLTKSGSTDEAQVAIWGTGNFMTGSDNLTFNAGTMVLNRTADSTTGAFQTLVLKAISDQSSIGNGFINQITMKIGDTGGEAEIVRINAQRYTADGTGKFAVETALSGSFAERFSVTHSELALYAGDLSLKGDGTNGIDAFSFITNLRTDDAKSNLAILPQIGNSDSGSVPILALGARRNDAESPDTVSTRPLAGFYNYTTLLTTVEADGTWDFKSHDLKGIKDLTVAAGTTTAKTLVVNDGGSYTTLDIYRSTGGNYSANQIRWRNDDGNGDPFTVGAINAEFTDNTLGGEDSRFKFYARDNGSLELFFGISNPLGTGTVYSDGGYLTNTNPSDRRLKENFNTLNYGLKEVLQLKHTWYNIKGEKRLQLGWIAQEVRSVIPELVTPFVRLEGNKKCQYLGLNTEAMPALNQRAIQELYDLMVKQQLEIDKLKKQCRK